MALKLRKRAAKSLRLTRRKLLAGAASLLLAAPFSRMAHSESLAPQHDTHPTWDMLSTHVVESAYKPNLADDWLRSWIAKLVHTPEERTKALMLVGPKCSGKTTFHQALGTLVTRRDYVTGVSFHKLLGDAATEVNPSLVVWDDGDRRRPGTDRTIQNRLTVPELKFGRLDGTASPSLANRIHWIECWQCDQLVPDTTLMQKVMLGRLPRPMPRRDLFRRLGDEKDSFMQTLARFAEPPIPLVSL